MKTLERFTSSDANELYGISNWAGGYFRIGKKGLLEATPTLTKHGVALTDIIDDVLARDESLPLIIRFPQILEHRVELLYEVFGAAIHEYKYPGKYQGVLPIKVNQRRVVVETIAEIGRASCRERVLNLV